MTTALLGFALASTLVILAPGPDRMLVMRNAMRGGRRAGWVTACGTLSGRGVRWLRRPAVQRWIERITGIVLIGFGLRLATESRRFA